MKIVHINKTKKGNTLAPIKTAIEKGNVLVLPTDTVYGLICDARNNRAVKKIFQIKQRDYKKPIGIFVKNIKMAEQLAEINDKQKKTIERYWPGKVTFILQKRYSYIAESVGAKDTIGIRVADYWLVQELFKMIDFPLAQTSANISGTSNLTRAKDILYHFKNKKNQPDLIFDAGELNKNKPSTVIDLTLEKPKTLRR